MWGISEMKRVIVYGAYGRNNLGDDYMLYYVNEFLKTNNIVPHYLHHGDEYYFKNINSEYIRYDCPLNKIYKNKIIKVFNIFNWLFKKDEFDAVIFMGGGYTNENFGLSKLLKIYLLSLKYRKKGVYFTGQTVGPAYSKIGKLLIKKIYNNAKTIFTREQSSFNYLNSLGIKNELIGDDAFLGWSPSEKKKAITIVSYKDFFDYDKFKNIFFDLVLKYARICNDHIVIIPFSSDERSKEFKLNNELFNKLKENDIDCELKFSRDIVAFNELMKSAKRVISGAYHAVTIGKMYGANALGLYAGDYYKSKIEGILNLYESTTNSLDMAQINNVESVFLKEFIDDCNDCYTKSKEIAANVHKGWRSIVRGINE